MKQQLSLLDLEKKKTEKKKEKSKKKSDRIVLSVSELTKQIKSQLENSFSEVFVQGEISNFKRQMSSGHIYFSLKDKDAQIQCIMFKGLNSYLKFEPEDGLEVTLKADVSVYVKRGNYQLVCKFMEPVGLGALNLAFNQLKEKLSKKGYFNQEHKKEIPSFPKKIGIVTSPTGAAIKDILHVLKRRYPISEAILSPCLVQGEKAAASIIEALNKIIEQKVDLILLGRGGGSLEDLWAFNEEKLIKAVFDCPIPVISCVGHETDFSLCDFVADLRAATPSMAAEIASPDQKDLILRIQENEKKQNFLILNQIELLMERIDQARKRLIDPRKKITEIQEKLRENMKKQIFLIKNLLKYKRTHLENLNLLMDSLSPLRVLQRGYSVVKRKGKIIKDSSSLKLLDEVSVKLFKGEFSAQVQKIKK